MFGVGATIGAGIFFVLSQQVPVAGPAVLISFIIAGITAGLTALCYAELSSMIPASGSSYSYAYATLGERVAFLVAACLILEYGVSAAAVAIGWSEYLNNLIANVFGVHLPSWMLSAPLQADGYRLHFGGDGMINLPASILVFLCCVLLMRGVAESAKVNAFMVVIKLVVLVLFIGIAASAFDANHLTPFAPHGFAGISAAAGSIFLPLLGLMQYRPRARKSKTHAATCHWRLSQPYLWSSRFIFWSRLRHWAHNPSRCLSTKKPDLWLFCSILPAQNGLQLY